jgi:hypothetical protein
LITLNPGWVKANFDEKFLSQIRNLNLEKKAFVQVPPGDNRSHPPCSSLSITTGPKVHYLQKEGKRTCMVYSFASAVHHMGWHQIASQIRNVGKKYEFKIGAFGRFANHLPRILKKFKTSKQNASTYDLLEGRMNCLILASIRGTDGKEDHCVTIYNGWIFDSNFNNALTLTKQSLDLCCSTMETKCNYDGCAQLSIFKKLGK